MPKSKKPMRAPYKLLFKGFEVIMQVPFAQPTNFQYMNPAMEPSKIPMKSSLYFLIIVFMKCNYVVISVSGAFSVN